MGMIPLYPERPLPRYTAFHVAAEEGIIPFYEKQRGDPLQVLELSGGGQNGAFGAGFLKGWRERGGWRHAEHRLPWCQEVCPMKIESIRQVKANLNQLVSSLAKEGSVVIMKNGRPCAVLMAVTEDTDLEIVALSQSKRFWRTFDRAIEKGDKEGWTPLDEL